LFPFANFPVSIDAGRVSLIYKSAAEEIWPLASSLDLTMDIPNPYDTIVCHTSLNLREISLVSHADYPTVLKHLRDQCPNLHSLSISSDLLRTFTRFDKVLGNIFERLKDFTVSTFDGFRNETDATGRLLKVVSECQSAPTIVSIALCWPTENETELKAVLSKLPSLTTLRMPLDAQQIDLIDLVSNCPSLERLRGLIFSAEPWFTRWPEWVSFAATSQTKIGLNLGFTELEDEFPGSADVPALSLMVLSESDTHAQHLSRLVDAGIKQKIDIDQVIEFLFYSIANKPFGEFEELVTYVSSKSPPFLPPPQDLARLIRTSIDICCIMIRKLPVSTIEAIVKLVGIPEVSPFYLVYSALERVDFDPSFIKLLYNMNIEGLSESNPLPTHPAEMHQYFSTESSVDGLKWLLRTLGDAKSRECLTFVHPKYFASLTKTNAMLDYYMFRRTNLAKTVIQHFCDDSNFLFSFPNESLFESFTLYCAHNDPDLFQRAVEATSLQLIPPGTRARVMAYFVAHLDDEKFDSLLEFWVGTIRGGPEPDFGAAIAGEPHIFSLPLHGRIRRFLSMWMKFKDTIMTQLGGLADLTALITNLAYSGEEIDRCIADQSFEPHLTALRTVLEDIFRMYSSTGRCATAVLMTYRFEYTPEFQSSLFDIALKTDFAIENGMHRSKFVAAMIKETIRLRYDAQPTHFPQRVALWIDYADAESLATKHDDKTIIDVILKGPIACQFDDLELVMGELVRRGARRTRFRAKNLDAQAVEIYNCALKQVNK
jgi:hypothetical protein